MATKAVTRKVKKDAKDVVGLDDDNDRKHRNKKWVMRKARKGQEKR